MGLKKGQISSTRFKKGHKTWNKGLTKETDIRIKNISIKVSETYKKLFKEGKEISPMKGKKHTKEAKEKNRKAHLGNKCWCEGKKLGSLSEEHKQKIRDANKGEKNGNWQGGISFEPYSPEFNNQLKEQIRQRDQYRCQQCFRHQDELTKNTKAGIRHYRLHIHHIDYNKQNNNFDNLISLCGNCHMQTNFKREDWENYFKNKSVYK